MYIDEFGVGETLTLKPTDVFGSDPHWPISRPAQTQLLTRVNGKEKWGHCKCKGGTLETLGGFTSGLFLDHA